MKDCFSILPLAGYSLLFLLGMVRMSSFIMSHVSALVLLVFFESLGLLAIGESFHDLEAKHEELYF